MKELTTTMMQQTLNKQDRCLTVCLDLGGRSSFYCVFDEVGDVLSEQRLSTTPKAIREIFGAMPGSRSRSFDLLLPPNPPRYATIALQMYATFRPQSTSTDAMPASCALILLPRAADGSLCWCYFFSAVFSVWARKSMRYCFHTMGWVWVP